MKAKNILIVGAAVAAFYWLNGAVNGFWNRIQFNFGGVKFGGIGGDFKSIIINPSLIVSNKNDFSIPVTGFQGWIYFQGQPFVPIRSIDNLPIQANGDSRLNYSVTIGWDNLKKLGENWKTVITGGNFRMIGDMEVTVSNIVYKFPINEPFTLEV
jgi:LEA14-like dessication related protein